MKRNLKEMSDENTPVMTEGALKEFQDKNERKSNSRNTDKPLFEIIDDNRKNYEEIRINGKSIDSIISDL